MIELADRADCTGCAACADACARRAIWMVEDADGFVFPEIDAARCVACGACASACPVLMPPEKYVEGTYFAAQLKDVAALSEVSSGGAFWALATTLLEKGGVVYGASQEAVDRIRHVRVETEASARALRRSKYLPSDMSGVCRALRDDVKGGRSVLFSGTGCQVAAVRRALGNAAEDRLVTCEVVCHGIPSMRAWRSYLTELERREKTQVADVVFRDKSSGWRRNQYRIVFADGHEKCEPSVTHPFHLGYLLGLFYRRACGHCAYAGRRRVADLTLADFWKYPGGAFSQTVEKGVSLVIVQTAAGRALIDAASDRLALERVSSEAAAASCRNLTAPPHENPHRAGFLALLRRRGYRTASRFYFKYGEEAASMPSSNFSAVREYFAEDGRDIFVADTLGRCLSVLFRPSSDAIVLAGRKIGRWAAHLRGFECMRLREAVDRARRHCALRDALLLLAKKGVPVYFFNRIGQLKNGFAYSPSARHRMETGASFPVMYADLGRYAADLKELFGEKYSPEYVEAVGKIPQVIRVFGRHCHEDVRGRLVNVVCGRRVTCGVPESVQAKIHVYGRCGAFGYAVEDADTMPSRLQAELVRCGRTDYEVVNHGLWGGTDDLILDNFMQDALGLAPGDVVVFYLKHLSDDDMARLKRWGVAYSDITARWHEDPAAAGCFYDRPGHMNATGYAIVARLVCEELVKTGFAGRPVSPGLTAGLTATHLTAYLKSRGEADVESALAEYLDRVKAAHPPLPIGAKCGAIVMNCNPFTNGHRYLIELAAREVDRLYIFVVEEDKSAFRFADRLAMVRSGVADIGNVVVEPSGRFAISTCTFPEYFMKDYVKEVGFDVSSDVRTFCERIAPALGITVRFAGEEPTDPVTRNYNRCMADLLPQFGMTFREIPRLALSDNRVVSATEVRRLMAEGDIAELARFVPATTLAILRASYMPKENA